MRALLAALVLSGGAVAADDDQAMGRKVQALLRAHQGEVFACVAKQHEPVTGEALLRVFVGAQGTPARVELLKAEAGKVAVRAAADCVAASARSWDLSGLGATEGDQVVFPLAFRPDPAPANAANAAVNAHVQLVRLRANTTQQLAPQHDAAYYVLGPGAPTVRGGPPLRVLAVGDLLYVHGGATATVSTKAPTALLEVQATEDVVVQGRIVPSTIASQDVAPISLFGGRGDVRLYLDGTAAPFAVDRLCAKRGVDVPRHQHETSDEIIYFIEGRGTTNIDDQPIPGKPGDQVTIPRGTLHAFHADQDLCAVQIYAPAGPEQRFKRPPP
jgi:quercetin dioxygenase-like cupin family protein